jgi:hypothetical protein
MDISESPHRHSVRFLQKRLTFFTFVVIALIALALTSFTGSVIAAVTGVLAVAAALVTGVSVACHRGCTPR